MNFSKLLKTQKTVFTVQQIGQIFGKTDKQIIRNQLTRRKKQGLLQNICQGIRALPHYSNYELANALKTPSYISLETVLYKAGIIFQYYDNTIFSISNNTKIFNIYDIQYQYHKINTDILLNPQAIVYQNGVATASIERAICDRLYLTPGYYFDNLRNISWDSLFDIATIYNNKRLLLDIQKLRDGTEYYKT